MSDDRTQPPSKRRRQLARERGQVAHSPELTAAAGWLVAVAALGFHGGDLAQGMVGLTRRGVIEASTLGTDPASLAALVQRLMFPLLAPLGTIIAGFAVGATAAHQLQVRGLWAPALLAPDPSRLWSPGRNGGLNAGLERVAWAIIKAAVLASVSFWLVRTGWIELERLSSLEFPALAVALGRAMLYPARVLGLVMLVLGLADYGLRYVRFEASLQTTREEQREDQRMMEGDAGARSRRMRLARAWRGDAPELLAGASLIVLGAGGLTVVLAGGPPPRRLTLRTIAQGNTGRRLRQTAHAARMPHVDAPELVRRLAAHAAADPLARTPVPAALMSELSALWPSRAGSSP